MSTTDYPLYNTKARDIAARYGVTEQHIRNLATAGDIPGVQLGTEWRFNFEEVHEALVSRSRTIRKPSEKKGNC